MKMTRFVCESVYFKLALFPVFYYTLATTKKEEDDEFQATPS